MVHLELMRPLRVSPLTQFAFSSLLAVAKRNPKGTAALDPLIQARE